MHGDPFTPASLAGVIDVVIDNNAIAPIQGRSTVLREASRVLKRGGRLVLCDMLPHDREEYKSQMGHVWLGFGEDQLRRLLGAAGFDGIRIVPLPVDPAAKGPALFVLSTIKEN